jgi:hypothetical protein
MKLKHVIAVIALFSLLVIAACKKSSGEDPHNHSLLDKSLDDIRSEIAGKWQMQRSHFYVCGFAGCNTSDTTYQNNTGDLVYFLTNDTVKQIGYTGYPTYIYEKATVSKIKVYYNAYNGFPVNVDSAYNYSMSNGYYQWIMLQIKNDSLVIYDAPWTYYLTRKP